jgi:cyclopropane fatty-acyl-phospholipid synthase-like methyltransferase
MPEKIADRFYWAAETLVVEPNDRLLEIGCGHGIAVSLICPKLTGGKIVAVDRSATMIEAAQGRNAAYVAAGQAEFHTAALDRAEFADAQFDKIFAINVNLFWTSEADELALIRKWLRPSGVLHLYYHPPNASKVKQLTDAVPAALKAHGFKLKATLSKDAKPAKLVCFVAVPAN